ncbi:predicted protein [Arabidopsis lyrata subsp. lyrata]|uniref:Predicted protein n=1 Tax=Arabidopsis lyrata subsp. lyrata TaxID=81972 RepID=D7MQ17_ARALL|nr:predicted protein [Arabidopsis lyrata subsp. lyrata]
MRTMKDITGTSKRSQLTTVTYEIVTELTKFEITNFQVLNDFYSDDKKSVYTNVNKTNVFYHPEALLISNLEMDMALKLLTNRYMISNKQGPTIMMVTFTLF